MITGNEPAYPTIEQDNVNGNLIWNTVAGLTIRQHFAAIALQGMYSNKGLVDQWDCENIMAENAVKAADALIEQLNKL